MRRILAGTLLLNDDIQVKKATLKSTKLQTKERRVVSQLCTLQRCASSLSRDKER
jgi:hypothetical protein